MCIHCPVQCGLSLIVHSPCGLGCIAVAHRSRVYVLNVTRDLNVTREYNVSRDLNVTRNLNVTRDLNVTRNFKT